MSYTVYDKSKIKARYDECFSTETFKDRCPDSAHVELREFLVKSYNELKEQHLDDFNFDLELGFKIYDFLNKNINFTSILKSNPNFWSTIAVFDIPDLVADRFTTKSSTHFYSKNTRVYPYTLYWFINLIWQGNENATRDMCKGAFNTDEILSFCERTTTIGVNVEFYRKIALRFSEYIKEKHTKKLTINGKDTTIVRYIFIINTSKLAVMRPELCKNGIDGYLDILFNTMEA